MLTPLDPLRKCQSGPKAGDLNTKYNSKRTLSQNMMEKLLNKKYTKNDAKDSLVCYAP